MPQTTSRLTSTLRTAVLPLLVISTMAMAAGDLDLSFGTSPGYSLIDFNPVDTENDQAAVVITDHAGRIVIAGFETHSTMSGSNRDMAVARLLPDGTLDPSFGTGGMRRVGFDLGGFEDGAVSLVETGDGKYVLCGLANDTDGLGGVGAYAVARLLENGNLDTSFDLDGRVSYYVPLPVATSVNQGGACDVMTDGRIVQVGAAVDTVSMTGSVSVARLLANGSLDPSFSDDGRLIYDVLDVPDPISLALDVKLRTDGTILVAGATNTAAVGNNLDMFVSQISSDGTLDGGFGSGGHQTIAFDQGAENTEAAYSLALPADGTIVLGGGAQTTSGFVDVAAVRLLANGQPDPSFGTGGRVLVGLDGGGDNRDNAQGVAVDTAGNIYLAGQVAVATDNDDAAVLRLLPDGTPDPDFGVNGWSVFGIDTSATFDTESFGTLALDGQGGVIAAGFARIGPSFNYDMLVARFNGDLLFKNGFEASP